MRKQAARETAEEQKRMEEARQDLIIVSSIVLFLLCGMAVIGVILLLTVK
jgi:hypothetical protein